MKIPSTIKIGGHQYKIIFPYVFTERYDRYGDSDFSKKIIRIRKAINGAPLAESGIIVVLIHEVLHAIDNTLGYDLFSGNDGERALEGLSEGIYQVLVDNPKLREVLK